MACFRLVSAVAFERIGDNGKDMHIAQLTCAAYHSLCIDLGRFHFPYTKALCAGLLRFFAYIRQGDFLPSF